MEIRKEIKELKLLKKQNTSLSSTLKRSGGSASWSSEVNSAEGSGTDFDKAVKPPIKLKAKAKGTKRLVKRRISSSQSTITNWMDKSIALETPRMDLLSDSSDDEDVDKSAFKVNYNTMSIPNSYSCTSSASSSASASGSDFQNQNDNSILVSDSSNRLSRSCSGLLSNSPERRSSVNAKAKRWAESRTNTVTSSTTVTTTKSSTSNNFKVTVDIESDNAAPQSPNSTSFLFMPEKDEEHSEKEKENS